MKSTLWLAVAWSIAFGLVAGMACADQNQGPGVTDTVIRIGQTMPYSGPVSAYGTIGRTEVAYLRKVNAEGGVNGRRIELISLDDAYSPPKTVEQIRRLVEEEQVLLLFQTMGTAPNTAIHKYVNAKRVPHLLISSGASRWADHQNYPWTMGYNVPYLVEGGIYAQYLLKERPNGKIAILYQNDDLGRDYLTGIRAGLGRQASTMIVAEATYETTDPTVDSQIVSLQASGADMFVILATPRAAAQAIRKAHDIGWRPLRILASTAQGTQQTLVPAGLERATGIVSASYWKDSSSAEWKDDPDMLAYGEFMRQYYPDGNPADSANVFGYTAAQVMVQILRQCGDDLTRENVMRQATNLRDFVPKGLLPGIRVNTSPTDFQPLEAMQLMRFDGQRWVRFGDVIGR